MKYLYLVITQILLHLKPLFSQQNAAAAGNEKPDNKVKQY